ncbi:MAG: hypothetical protein ACI4YB_00480 [Oscillospiraceae bacterium]
MDNGKLLNNTVFYDGFEDEPEIELYIEDAPEYNIHIWNGYLYDILGELVLDGKDWNGFTCDMNQCERTYEEKMSRLTHQNT